jgi:uncharacterized protein YfaP (DUF2135 family)
MIVLIVSFLIGCSGGSSSVGATRVATLTWNAPATNTDGSPVTLAGYKIYYGTSSHAYTQSVDVANTGTTPVTYTLNLSQGIFYFAVTAINTEGQESDYSNEVSKII